MQEDQDQNQEFYTMMIFLIMSTISFQRSVVLCLCFGVFKTAQAVVSPSFLLICQIC